MPTKPLSPCRAYDCPGMARGRGGYCAAHASMADDRPSAASRGYGAEWRKIREAVLTRAGIPPKAWHLYDIDHEPPYNPAMEYDHRRYKLTPRLHGAHSSKTAERDGGFGNIG